MEELRCPKCKSDRISTFYIMDEYGDVSDGNNIIQRCMGHCKDCGCDISFERIFRLIWYRDIKLL